MDAGATLSMPGRRHGVHSAAGCRAGRWGQRSRSVPGSPLEQSADMVFMTHSRQPCLWEGKELRNDTHKCELIGHSVHGPVLVGNASF